MALEDRALHMESMGYRVIYYDKDGQEIGSAPWADSLEATRRIAQAGLIRHGAASVRIFDEDQNNRQVWPRA